MNCKFCGKEFTPANKHSWQRFCSTLCSTRYKHKLWNLRPAEFAANLIKKPCKSLTEWTREADACNLDYGTYRALIAQGKTFDELKATADRRHMTAHQRATKSLRGVLRL